MAAVATAGVADEAWVGAAADLHAQPVAGAKAVCNPPATEVDPGLPGWALPSSVEVEMVDLAETASLDVTWFLGATNSWQGGIGTVG